jgi:hypothetical protein
MEDRGSDTDRWRQKYSEKNVHSDTLSTANLTSTDLWPNPGLCGEFKDWETDTVMERPVRVGEGEGEGGGTWDALHFYNDGGR